MSIKRLTDITVSAVLLVLLMPLFLLIAIGCHAQQKGSVLFSQRRIGRDNRPFTIYKFRTMPADAPPLVSTAAALDTGVRLTAFSAFLRRTGLDELPQLWNILVGDMSFVGPRPVVVTETRLLALRHIVGATALRPGLTGLAQVTERYRLTDRQKALMDGWYYAVDSLWLDIQLVWCTVGRNMKRKKR